MKKQLVPEAGFFNPRVVISFAFGAMAVVIAVIALVSSTAATARAEEAKQNQTASRFTAGEAQKIADGIKPLLNNSVEGLVTVKHADGSESIDLQGRFQNVTLVKREADGSVSQTCVNNADSAAAFLGIDPQLLKSSTTAPDQSRPK